MVSSARFRSAANAPADPLQALTRVRAPVVPIVRARPLRVRVWNAEALERRVEVTRLIHVVVRTPNVELQRGQARTIRRDGARRAAPRIARPPARGVATEGEFHRRPEASRILTQLRLGR